MTTGGISGSSRPPKSTSVQSTQNTSRPPETSTQGTTEVGKKGKVGGEIYTDKRGTAKPPGSTEQSLTSGGTDGGGKLERGKLPKKGKTEGTTEGLGGLGGVQGLQLGSSGTKLSEGLGGLGGLGGAQGLNMGTSTLKLTQPTYTEETFKGVRDGKPQTKTEDGITTTTRRHGGEISVSEKLTRPDGTVKDQRELSLGGTLETQTYSGTNEKTGTKTVGAKVKGGVGFEGTRHISETGRFGEMELDAKLRAGILGEAEIKAELSKRGINVQGNVSVVAGLDGQLELKLKSKEATIGGEKVRFDATVKLSTLLGAKAQAEGAITLTMDGATPMFNMDQSQESGKKAETSTGSGGVGVSGSAKAFAGAMVGAQISVQAVWLKEITDQTGKTNVQERTLANIGAKVEGYVGAGAKAEFKLGLKDGKLDFKAEAGVSLGVGLGVGVEGGVDLKSGAEFLKAIGTNFVGRLEDLLSSATEQIKNKLNPPEPEMVISSPIPKNLAPKAGKLLGLQDYVPVPEGTSPKAKKLLGVN